MQIGIEDFRVMSESFGMQLDDDSLLALFSRVRPHPTLPPALPAPLLPCPTLPYPAQPCPVCLATTFTEHPGCSWLFAMNSAAYGEPLLVVVTLTLVLWCSMTLRPVA